MKKRRINLISLLCIAMLVFSSAATFGASKTVTKTATPKSVKSISIKDSKTFFPKGKAGDKAKNKFSKEVIKYKYTLKNIPVKTVNGEKRIIKSKLSKRYINSNTKVQYYKKSNNRYFGKLINTGKAIKFYYSAKAHSAPVVVDYKVTKNKLTVTYYNKIFIKTGSSTQDTSGAITCYIIWYSKVVYKI